MKVKESATPDNKIKINLYEPRELDNEQKTLNSEEQILKVKSVQEEVGGPAGPEPTRYGDWEVKGRCSDF
jgi:hypothetical protein